MDLWDLHDVNETFMKYEELKKFIQEKMKPDKSSGEEKNYQPVMIRTLNKNHGKATQSKIMEDLQKWINEE